LSPIEAIVPGAFVWSALPKQGNGFRKPLHAIELAATTKSKRG
jgi:hypothetical protein